MAKIDRRCSAPPENMLAMPRMPLRLVLEEARHRIRVDARDRDEGADAVHDHAGDQERQTAADLAEA